MTPDATAERIVSGVTAFFDAYAKQNPDLEGEELIESFMKEVRSGVDKGYDEAFKILEDLGAFEFDGVKDGVQQTKALIESKLQAWESAKRKELGLETQDTASQVSSEASSGLLAQAANQVSVYV